MLSGDFIDYRQSETTATAGGARNSIEPLQYSRPFRLGNSRSVILYLQEWVTRFITATYGDASTRWCVLEGVIHEVAQQVIQQPCIRIHAGGTALRAKIETAFHSAVDISF